MATRGALGERAENRAAAITTLGKTVEVCMDNLDDLGPGQIEELRAALQAVNEPVFSYDVQFIKENFPAVDTQAEGVSNVPTQPSTPAAVNTLSRLTPTTPLQLVGKESFSGHTGAIFTINVDEAGGTIMSTGRDGLRAQWSMDGRRIDSQQFDRHYACSADINLARNCYFLSAAPRDAPAGAAPPPGKVPDPFLCVYKRPDGAGPEARWQPSGTTQCRGVKIAACVKCISPAHNRIASGQQFLEPSGPNRRRECIAVYDLEGGHGQEMTPTVQYWDHEELITCLAPFPAGGAGPGAEGQLFFSGSKDRTVRLWDLRARASAAVMGPGGGPGAVETLRGHTQMITSVDSFGTQVVSAGFEPNLLVWDLRQLAQPQRFIETGQQVILKIAATAAAGGLVAVASLKNLLLVRLADGAIIHSTSVPGRPVCQPYHDLKWVGGGLWAGGEDKTVDFYGIVPG